MFYLYLCPYLCLYLGLSFSFVLPYLVLLSFLPLPLVSLVPLSLVLLMQEELKGTVCLDLLCWSPPLNQKKKLNAEQVLLLSVYLGGATLPVGIEY